MKTNKFLETEAEYYQAVEQATLLAKVDKRSPTQQREYATLNVAIDDFNRRRRESLEAMVVLRSGLAGLNHLGSIVDRRIDPTAKPVPPDPVYGIPKPLPLTHVTFDFYFSLTQAVLYGAQSKAFLSGSAQIPGSVVENLLSSWFKDTLFTRAVASGSPKPTDFDDYEWVGTGTLSDTRFRGRWHEINHKDLQS